ncbi:MAG: hypothetical protein ABIZ09_13205 [Rhodoferax sp.]
MNAFSSGDSIAPTEAALTQESGTGVRGWLLVLCLMLTIIGPLISAWLMAEDYAAPGVSLLAQAVSTVFGMYAGIRLWLIQTNSVNITKIALLVGLAADILSTAIAVTTDLTSGAVDDVLMQTLFRVAPSLIFFTLSFAYLQHSRRVHFTYVTSTPDT